VTKVTVLDLWRRSSVKKQTLDCVATVSKLDVLKPLSLVSSEKQTLQAEGHAVPSGPFLPFSLEANAAGIDENYEVLSAPDTI
jgi:hypothetical protein